MIEPQELIAVARELVGSDRAVTDAHVRRAISTVYYALFHLVLSTAANRFVGMGPRMHGAYALFYRGYGHGDMRQACLELAKSTLRPALERQLGRTAVSGVTREFAILFPEIQRLRDSADYDPAVSFGASDVLNLIEMTERAMDAFRAIEPAEQADVLALMLVKSRA